MAKRGLANASKETRKRVAQAGGRASHGGGRRPKNDEYFSEIRMNPAKKSQKKEKDETQTDETLNRDDWFDV
jgi:hypothetical protein